MSVRLARQQRLELGPGRTLANGLELPARLLEAGLVTLFIGEFGVTDSVRKVTLKTDDRLDRARQPGTFATDRLGLFRSVPKGRILDPSVQFMQLTEGEIPVKVSS